jgi:diguanylate cyclase (GGDEF)-like protein
MQLKVNAEELNAMKEARNLVQSQPKEAPALFHAVIDQYKSEGKIGCALEARRWQCFAFMANLDYFEARQHLEILISEASQANQHRYVGVAEMYHGVIALECGESEEAVEYFGHAIQIATELEDLDLLCRVQTNLAYAQITQERCEEALETLKNCIRPIDVDDVSVSNATIYYNIATTILLLAFQEKIEGVVIDHRLRQADSALQIAIEHSFDDSLVSLLTKVQGALYTGLASDAVKGLEQLDKLEPEISVSSASHRNSFWVVKCQLLEVAKKWPELCRETEAFLEYLNASRSLVFCQSVLRQASRAHAKMGDFETAFYLLQRSLTRRAKSINSKGEDRARFVSMQQDLEQQKFDQDVLRMRNKTLVERNKILEQEARYDPLSGLLNRRGTEEALQQYCDRKFATNFMIVLLDIDHFKKINDNFGHAMGDQVIHEFATCLANSATNPAKIGRWGGEEFLVVYDVTDIQEMEMIGQTLITEIRNLNWDHIHKGLRVTASCGLSMWNRGDSIDNAIRISDDMMYEVKNHGRNNWRVWSHDEAA